MRKWSVCIVLLVTFYSKVDCTCLENLNLKILNGSVYRNEYLLEHTEISEEILECVCQTVHCIRKCCAAGHFFDETSCAPIEEPLNVSIYDGEDKIWTMGDKHPYVYFTGHDCKFGQYLLTPGDENDAFYPQPDGSLNIPQQSSEFTKFHEYCLEYFVMENESFVTAMVCSVEEDTVWHLSVGKFY